MGNILKELYSLKALGLGWAVWWRSFLVILVNAVIIMVLSMILQYFPSAIANLLNIIITIYMVILGFLAMGWAVIKIKDKI
ncbi:MAG: hypothetical protein KKA31_06435 [Candidatus Margulisbacteria bacterium]|nr:hypothetical protein [Candidatus Margulisiibacteriota bacterium]